MPRLSVHHAGCLPYAQATAWQRALLERRVAGAINDTLLLLEHPPTVTLSRRSGEADLLADAAHLRRLGIAVEPTTRGGLATLHSPGQLVGYPIFDLTRRGRDLHAFLRRIEQLVIDTAAACGVDAHRTEGKTGVWAAERKLASIGIAVHRWTSWHGFALNVCNDLALFDTIVPCGLAGVQMTSLSVERGRAVDMRQAASAAVQATAAVFGFDAVEIHEDDPSGFAVERTSTIHA